jgi:hypothetical protein
MIRLSGLYLLLLLFAACSNGAGTEQKAENRPDFFFDIKGYFEGEIERLNASQPKVEKTASINELKETQTLEQLDYAKELALFVEADINKIAWEEKYTTSEEALDDGTTQLTHEALDEDLRVRKIEVILKGDDVQSITIFKGLENVLAGSDQLLSYSPTKGYAIESEQSLIMDKTKKMKMEVAFK